MASSEHTALRHGDQLHRRYAIREWCCIDGELTCFRVYLPSEGRDRPEGFEQPDVQRQAPSWPSDQIKPSRASLLSLVSPGTAPW
jgi:hypothetical protein